MVNKVTQVALRDSLSSFVLDFLIDLCLLLGMESLLLKSLHLLLFDSKELLKFLKVVHEDSSSLKSSLLNHNLRLREKLKKVLKDFLRHAEECGSVLFGSLF